MKIERAKLKKSNSELPEACKPLRDRLVAAKDDKSMYDILRKVKTWEYGKSELFHWVDVLDMFDSIMERCCEMVDGNKWMLACDQPDKVELKLLMLQVMRFTSMLIEYSFQRHSYESMDHLIALLSSSDMEVVLEVLNVLYVFSKRSNFMGRLSAAKKHEIVIRLQYLAESWGGKENGFGLAECCQDLPAASYPSSATTVHFEFYINRASKTQPSNLCTIHLEKVDQLSPSPSQVMTKVLAENEVPENKQMLLFTHIRLAHAFSSFRLRASCILARLQAISVLVYSHAGDNDVAHQIIYNGFINELVNVLELPSTKLIDMKAAVMRTLTAIIHLERNPKLEAIIDVTGANTYHGFLPSLVRKCILQMVEPGKTAFPHSFSTALFSFLYHLASYESGGEALLSCGIMPSLLQLASWHSDQQEHITFVTRAVRIIDLITNMDTQSFENHNGLKVFIERLDHEVTLCRQEQPYIIRPTKFTSLISVDSVAMDVSETSQSDSDAAAAAAALAAEASEGGVDIQPILQPADVDNTPLDQAESSDSVSSQTASSEPMESQPGTSASSRVIIIPVLKTGVQCLPQRSALLKSILNFFKKVIPEPTISFADSVRHIMEGTMPKALQHIISNAEYYGASLFQLALDVVTVFVFQEPSLLSSLQDKGLTEVVLESLLIKDVPTTREVLAALPNVFSALCLNQRGLDAFVEYKPFDKLFKVLLSPEYLPAMRKRKSSDAFGDTANNLGTAMDELMRHQPSLRTPAIKAIIGLLEEIRRLGTDTRFVCATKATEVVDSTASVSAAAGAQTSSDIESEDDDEVTEGAATQSSMATHEEPAAAAVTLAPDGEAKPVAPKPVPLMDYILNVMKFVDAIMGNTTADDHCTEFVNQGGLEPLFAILRLPNLPVDFPNSQACQSVSSVCTILLKLCHEAKVLEEGLKHLDLALKAVQKLYEPLPPPGGSVLLSELAGAVSDTCSITEAVACSAATPLLHSLSAIQSYVKVFIHMCRFGQADLRQISLAQWSTQKGLQVLNELGQLYFTLVWEGTVLLAVCSDSELLPTDSEFGRADMAKLLPKCSNPKDMDTDSNSSVGVTAAMEGLSTGDMAAAAASAAAAAAAAPSGDDDAGDAGTGEAPSTTTTSKTTAALANQMKQVRPLLNVSSRLGSTLSELFQNVLVKLCVGSVMLRQRRTHQAPPAAAVPSANARAIVRALCNLSTQGLKWTPPADVPKLRMSFLMCAVGFTLPMLFEENKRSYHLMLQEFSNSLGLEAFFDVFDEVLDQLPPPEYSRDGRVAAKLPDYTIEFLDTWLLLAEKIVHPKYILDSIYPLPDKGNTSDYEKFNPTEFLKSMLKPVFDSVLKLWHHEALTNTLDADATRMAQLEQVAISILTILCHIIQAEKTIKEKETGVKDYSKTKGAAGSSTTSAASSAAGTSGQAAATRPGLAPLSEDNVLLRDLMDMGFSRERCVEALNYTSTVEQATEYLITHMIAGSTAGGHQPSTAMDMSLSEDEQIRAAIELSLTAVSNDTPTTTENRSATTSKRKTVSRINKAMLSTNDISNLTEQLISGCTAMLDAMPNTVFKICQLIVASSKRNGEEWRKEMFKQLFLEIGDASTQLSDDALGQAWGSTQQQAIQYFSKGRGNLKLASRMHLLTLLIQELDLPCISLLQDNGFIHSVLHLVGHCMPGLRLAGTSGTPQWLAPIMLIIDQCEKAAVASRRKAEAKKVLGSSTAWKWFDDRNGRWCAYNGTSNSIIDNAYKNGETSVRFSAGRRKYLIQFNAMLQLNEETGNRRPVMLQMPTKEDRAKNLESQMDTDSGAMEGLLAEQTQTLIKCCVDLISVPVECETLHAVLRLCLRCTRRHGMAELFLSYGGIDQLLTLSQASAFTGFTSLSTLLIRHVLEDESTLKQSFFKVLREVTSGLGSSLCGVSANSMGSKEMHYVMRQMGPAMCRNSELLKILAKSNLKISLQNGKEPPWTAQHQVDIITAVPDKSPSISLDSPSETFKRIITSLLNILITPYPKDEPSAESSDSAATVLPKEQMEVDTTPSTSQPATQPATTTSVLEGLLLAMPSSAADSKSSNKTPKDGKKDSGSPSDKADKRLLSKSCVLRMLSEFIKSYPHCVNIIVQHMYMAGQTDLVPETCTALSFIFDKLLPSNQEDGDKDCPALSRVLLAGIASCNHSPEAQTALVNELKATLQRTLAMPEVGHKYTHIQSLTGLVSTLVEACPSNQAPMKSPLLMKSMAQQMMNQMVKLMVKRGLVSDLARIPHSLDLSNPSSVNTINALLKPLETLSRIVNQPQLAPPPTNAARTPAARFRQDIEQSAANTQSAEPAAADAGAADAADTQSNSAPPADQTNSSGGPGADGVADAIAAIDSLTGGEFDDGDNDDGENDNSINLALSRRISEMERQAEDILRGEISGMDNGPGAGDVEERLLSTVQQQVSEVLEQALDEILSQGRSDHSADDELERANEDEDGNLSDIDDAARDEDRADDDEVAPYHDDEEDDTSEDDEDDDEDDEDDAEDEGENGANPDGGELGMDDDDGWSDEDDIGGAGGLANILAFDDDDDLFSRLEAYDPLSIDHGIGRPRILVADPTSEGFRTLQMPMGAADMDPAYEESGLAALPPAPNAVPVIHPLMNPTAAVASEVNRSQSRFMPGLARSRRPAGSAGRTAADRMAASDRMALHMMHHAPQNTLIHRLFGTGVAANILQLTTRMGAGGARLYISDDDHLRTTASRSDDDQTTDFLQDGMEMVKSLSGPGILNSVPSTFYRWIEECRVLDGPSVHDVITVVKPEIIDHLQADKKEMLESTAKKDKEAKEKKSQTDKEQGKSASSRASAMAALAATSRRPGADSPRDVQAGIEAMAAAMAETDSELQSEANRLAEQSRESRELLSSMQALFGDRDNLAQNVARMYSRRQELRALMSVPQAQPHTNASEDRAARTITTSVNDRSDNMADFPEMTVAYGGEMEAVDPVPETQHPDPPILEPLTFTDEPESTTSAVEETVVSAIQPSDTLAQRERISPVEFPPDEEGADELPLPSDIEQLPLPEQVSQEDVAELAAAAAQAAAAAARVDQDRACTPPNIFYDGDEPAVPPQAENRPDSPVPLASLVSLLPEDATPAAVTAPTLLGAALEAANTLDTSTVSSATTSPAATATLLDNANSAAESQSSAAADISSTPSTSAAPDAVTDLASSAAASSAAADASNSSSLPAGLEGVDPSFLEALPESIRKEVIAEQLRLARVQNQIREQAAAAAPTPAVTTTAGSSSSTASAPSTSTAGAAASGGAAAAAAGGAMAEDVSAEFLAALPPAIQEEVLAVQRAEQARQTAAQAGPDNTQDPGSFLLSLPPSLRQQVLADMDDSQVSVLPADLMEEAHQLRGELEDRNRRLQSQLFSGTSGSSLGSILRQSGLGGSGMNRLTASRFARRGAGFSGPWTSGSGNLRGIVKSSSIIRRGRQLLDQEALACLLVLLFLDEPRLNVSRLHRILKNLGYHLDTLLWIVRALISILVKTNESKDTYSESAQPGGGKQPSQSAWLSFGMDAALGCRANVFQVHHHSSYKRTAAANSAAAGSVNIHPQAAILVCQHVMDTLIYLSKAFTNHFLPSQTASAATGDTSSDSAVGGAREKDPNRKSPKQMQTPPGGAPSSQTFWDVLVRLDQMRLTRKGKGVQRMSTSISSGALSSDDSLAATSSIEESPLGQLMTLLSSPVIRRSPTLTDRLLKLLSNISTAISSETDKASSGVGRPGPSWWEPGESSATQPRTVVDKDTVLLPNQLQFAVEVLTSKSCSEEGLEDSTRLLLRLSNANEVTKQNIVKLLLSGALQIGQTVCLHIESLLNEAREYNQRLSQSGGLSADHASSGDLQSLDASGGGSPSVNDARPSTSSAAASRGLIPNRYQEGAMVMIAPAKTKARSHDLQLPSMSLLTAKSSSQQFLLRLLKVIIQLNEKKPPAASTGSGTATTSGTISLAAQESGVETLEAIDVEQTEQDAAASSEANAASEPANQPTTMEVDAGGPSTSSQSEPAEAEQPLCEQLDLDKLWEMLGLCLTELSLNSDHNAVLILQPAVETFFLVHAGEKDGTSAKSRSDRMMKEDQLSHLKPDDPPASPAAATSADSLSATKSEDNISPQTKKFLKFAETHRTVLNQILRQSQTPLSDGPFSVLVDHMKLLDFDVKNRYFKAELQKLDEGMRREDVAVHVRRDHVFEDSYRELFRRTPDEWKHRLYIVFEGEEGQDAGGLLREWYLIMSREIFNPNYALFMITPQDRVTYTINQLSYYNTEHLSYFKFVGRIIAKAIYDNKLLDCYFTRSFYKHVTGQPVRYTDMEAEDYSFYQGLEFLLNNDIKDLGYDLTFSTEIQELGVTETRELKCNGANIVVTEENKKEYVKLVCQSKMTGAIRRQLTAFLEGFYDIIPKYLISIFNEQELELLISGLPTVDVDDLKANTEYHKYNISSLQVIWFWRALRSFDQAERARFLQFVTGTSKVPLQGFAYLEGMNGTQKFQIHRDDRSTDRLPCAHTCFNQLDLPAYETFDKLKRMLLLVINECSEGFGLA